MKDRGSLRPTAARMACGRDYDAAVFRVQLDRTGEAGLLKERFGNANTMGVANGDDSTFDRGRMRHGIYNVSTAVQSRKEASFLSRSTQHRHDMRLHLAIDCAHSEPATNRLGRDARGIAEPSRVARLDLIT